MPAIKNTLYIPIRVFLLFVFILGYTLIVHFTAIYRLHTLNL